MLQWRARHLIAVIAITITGISAPALAQTYPERPVKLVTQGAAGSGPDVIARSGGPAVGSTTEAH